MKELLKVAAKGVLKVTDKALTGGIYHNIKEETKVSEKGSFDVNKFVRTLTGSTIPVILLIALLKGWVTLEEVKSIIKVFGL
jgi:hypothetical protein